jgi:hypothetical protein
MQTDLKLIGPGIMFLLTLATGFWLSHSGKPLKTSIITVHKLIALGGVILAGEQIYRAIQAMEIPGLLLLLIASMIFSVLVLFGTGAFLSQKKPTPAFLLTMHQIAPLAAAGSLALTAYLLTGRTL